MPCFHPLQAYYGEPRLNGKKRIVFDERLRINSLDLKLPCGQCVGCRLERSRQWAVRCVHEAQLYERNCFITLTFNEESLWKRDKPLSLDKRDWQTFMRNLRDKFGNGIRYYHCGEYGDNYGRPHYHACLFNFDFPDRTFWKETNGFRLYTSEILQGLWPFGYSSVGNVSFESAAYVARYILKKINGKKRDELVDVFVPINESVFSKKHYEVIDFNTGEIYEKIPEYTTMSRGGRSWNGKNLGGIGNQWFDMYKDDVYPHDYVVVRNKKVRPPRYYDNKLEEEMLIELKENRLSNLGEFLDDLTPERLSDREKVAIAGLSLFGRNVE